MGRSGMSVQHEKTCANWTLKKRQENLNRKPYRKMTKVELFFKNFTKYDSIELTLLYMGSRGMFHPRKLALIGSCRLAGQKISNETRKYFTGKWLKSRYFLILLKMTHLNSLFFIWAVEECSIREDTSWLDIWKTTKKSKTKTQNFSPKNAQSRAIFSTKDDSIEFNLLYMGRRGIYNPIRIAIIGHW